MQKLMLILLIPLTILATEYKTGSSIRVSEADTVYSDLFVGAQYLEIKGYVDGDVYAGCERITIDGEVKDDVRSAGKEILIRGTIGDGLIAMGEYVLIDGVVHGDVLAFGGKVHITPSGHVKGNVFVGSGEFRIDGGRVGGNIKGGAGSVYLNGSVKGVVELEVDEISFGEGNKAGGGTLLKLDHELDITQIENAPSDLQMIISPKKRFFQSVFFYWAFLAALIVGGLIIAFAKNFVRDYIDTAYHEIAKNLGIGILTIILVPIAVLILLLLVLTIPVGLIGLAIYLILLYLSSIFAAMVAGDYIQKFWHKNGSPLPFLSLLIGLVAVFLLTEVPFVGWLICLAVISFGCGSLILYIWNLVQPTDKAA
jgi:cytoskeletal protein CcmA (bactofilin family)